ncbi:hypothetical protein Micbo1qcDRAFT_207791 [Microdochium bolleyi]|uniref:Fungal N-terminal domain-containing protein n=1 Tax=Microdochium bolleyi TaxID=196109 RepID=A0A136IT21_9PEZI|nr:hypothetical protein Micbo1qcDRAFT_207791 [Microdochium bolleyi]
MEVAGTALAVASAAATTTLAITKLVIEARELKEELETTQAELKSIDGVLFTIADLIHSSTFGGSAISAALLQRVSNVLKRCDIAVMDTSSLVRRFSGGGLRRTAKWLIAGKQEVAAMQVRLVRCKQDLNLVLSMLNMSISNANRMDTAQLVQGNDSIQRDVQHIILAIRSLQDDHAKMDELLVLLRSQSAQSSHNPMLNEFMDNLTTYAQTVYERSTVIADEDLEAYSALPSRPPFEQGEADARLLGHPTESCIPKEEDWDSIFSDTKAGSQSPSPLTRSDNVTNAINANTNKTRQRKWVAVTENHYGGESWDHDYDNDEPKLPMPPPITPPSPPPPPAPRVETLPISLNHNSGIATAVPSAVPTDRPRDGPARPEAVRLEDKLKYFKEELAKPLLAAIKEADADAVRSLLRAGANPSGRMAWLGVGGQVKSVCCSGGVSNVPLMEALTRACSEAVVHDMVPVVEILCEAGAELQWPTAHCSGALMHLSVLSRYIQLVGARIPQERELSGSGKAFRFVKAPYETEPYRNAPGFASLLISNGADPDHGPGREWRNKPLMLALQSYNPKMASMLVLKLLHRNDTAYPAWRHHTPFIPHQHIGYSFTSMILRNILIQHKCLETSPWLRYIIETDEKIGALLLCQTITFLSQREALKWDFNYIVVGVFALVSFDADPLLRVNVSYQKIKSIDAPSSTASAPRVATMIRGPRRGQVVSETINAMELIAQVVIAKGAPPETRERIRDIMCLRRSMFLKKKVGACLT